MKKTLCLILCLVLLLSACNRAPAKDNDLDTHKEPTTDTENDIVNDTPNSDEDESEITNDNSWDGWNPCLEYEIGGLSREEFLAEADEANVSFAKKIEFETLIPTNISVPNNLPLTNIYAHRMLDKNDETTPISEVLTFRWQYDREQTLRMSLYSYYHYLTIDKEAYINSERKQYEKVDSVNEIEIYFQKGNWEYGGFWCVVDEDDNIYCEFNFYKDSLDSQEVLAFIRDYFTNVYPNGQ